MTTLISREKFWCFVDKNFTFRKVWAWFVLIHFDPFWLILTNLNLLFLPFQVGERIRVILDCDDNTLAFERNYEFLGVAFRGKFFVCNVVLINWQFLSCFYRFTRQTFVPFSVSSVWEHWGINGIPRTTTRWMIYYHIKES